MKILVTGATGFVGRHLVAHLVREGHEVVALSRSADERIAGAETARGDVGSGDGLREAARGCDAVIHLVGIIQERGDATFRRIHVDGTRNVLEAAQAEGIRRYVHMSALGAARGTGSEYFETKIEAEELVARSNLDWVILRPSLIFGDGSKFFEENLRGLVTGPPLIPLVGDGSFPFRPVSIEDVARAFEGALTSDDAVGRRLELVGPTEYTLRELIERVKKAYGVTRPLVPVPVGLVRLGVPVLQFLPNPPVTRDQFIMLLQGNTGDPEPAAQLFDLPLVEIDGYLAALGARAAR